MQPPSRRSKLSRMLVGLERSIRESKMTTLAKQLGKVDPFLLPDRHEPYRLHDVLEKVIDGCRDEIVLNFGDSYLSFKALPDTDEIAARFHSRRFPKRGFASIG